MPAAGRGPYIGLMSGTSLDGVDGLLVEFDAAPDSAMRLRTLGFASRPFDADLRDQLFALQTPGPDELARAALAANALSDAYAEVVRDLLRTTGLEHGKIVALGAHGQTVRHRPDLGYTIQLLAPARLAEATGIDVVADLRSADIAAGGQGAPLVPAFHAEVFDAPGRVRAIANIGGIGNVTRLDGRGGVTGYDTGPGNLLLDGWCLRHRGEPFDADGRWAATGRVQPALLQRLLGEPWFALPPPRSTGRDLFGLEWLDARLAGYERPEDVQATLVALTVETLRRGCDGAQEIHVCGGGARNDALMTALARACTPATVTTTESLGLPPQAVEAAAFAWLARARVLGESAGRPAVTGARGPRVLGAVWPAPR